MTTKTDIHMKHYIGPLLSAALFSGIVNLFGLAGPLFMLEIYDRVIPSKSTPTLIALLLLVAAIYGFSSLFDALRTRILARVASLLDQFLCRRVFAVIIGASLRTKIEGDVLKPAHELDQIRNFLSSPGPAALFDLPWMPIYLFICYLMHPMIGWLAIGSVLLLVVLTIMTDLFTRSRMREASQYLTERNQFGEAAHANSEVIAAMAMQDVTATRWLAAHTQHASRQRSAGDATSMLMSVSKNVRLMIQSGSLALGAYLVIVGDLTGGMIIAASILISRTLAPIEQVIANWRAMLAARQSWNHLKAVMQMFPPEQERTSLPAPCKCLALENVFVSPPAAMHMMAVQNVSFRVNAGSVVGIIGPSASGKSSLVRAIASVWPLARGKITLDGASLIQWISSERGQHIGYMPQQSDLFPGTIAENISRLDPDARHHDIIAAAKSANVHDLIVSLPDGYETIVGTNGLALSAGQRQRIALARALFGDPFLVVLDEPNSNLDQEGDEALAKAIAGIRERNGIVIVVAHRNSILSQLDYLLLMEHSVARAYGPRDAVLATINQQQNQKRQRNAAHPSLATVDGEET